MARAAQDLLLGKLVGFIENEASTIAGVGDKVDEIRQELVHMIAFLKDAEGKKAQTEGDETWVASIRDSVFDVEDIIAEFTYRTYQQQREVGVARLLHIPKNLWYKRKIARKLDKIKRTIDGVSKRNKRYGGSVVVAQEGSSTNSQIRDQAEACLFTNEDELVGIEAPKELLMEHLVNGPQSQTIFSVVGMGGSGKTTLVAQIFKNDIVKRHFSCHAWVTVSQTCEIEDLSLFRSLIKEFHQSREEEVPGDIDSMSYRELVKILDDYLNSKRYLVVLDDVWSIEVWKKIKVSLQDRQLGSRVVLTTRNKEIARYAFGVPSHVHDIQPLKEENAWVLFSKKAFHTHPNQSCPPGLQRFARELVGKCNGLPLAIEALSGLMSSKNSHLEWSHVCNSLNWHLTNDPELDYMRTILLLSFNDLSYQLKHCFLYCSLFPEDCLMKRKRLIRLWIAEGFVQHVKGATPEVTADRYLSQLCFRSMLQVVERNVTGRPKECRMHDLMREVALSTSEKEKFGVVHDEKEKFGVVYDGKDEAIEARRLSIQSQGEIISSTESIGKLLNLQTLNIRQSGIEELPKGISKLVNLRHLIMYSYTGDSLCFQFVKGTRIPVNVSKLNKLQVLSCVEAEGDIINQVSSMTQLVSIGITNVKESDGMNLCNTITKLQLLQSLCLVAINEEEVLQTDAISQSPPPLLRVVSLAGRLQNVPQWFKQPLQSLTCLYLHWSKLEENLVPHIEALPNLEKLILVNAYVGKQLYFHRGFLKLKELYLANHPLLTEITIKKDVMPYLHELHVEHCMSLKTVPVGLEHLTNLQRFILKTVPENIIQPIRKGGVNHSKVQNIPEIIHFSSETSYDIWS
ncbi:disease resistance protein RPM1-like isoform X2 [Argentina anserina]|uniref:disease resistance protein RPM1-like isoform X2 n=1 Tax=Argentina anserina TaxID=57926 RepID=UPI0021764079|nr:disease resistance protein RPM1-like isoform X2 [Potentilla anserina]